MSIDFRNLQYAENAAALLFAVELKTIRDSRPFDEFNAPNSDREADVIGYLKHIGFFRYFGLKIGNAPGQASGSFAYQPITILDIERLRSYWPEEACPPIVGLQVEGVVRSAMNINGRTMEELEQRRYSTVALIAAYFAVG